MPIISHSNYKAPLWFRNGHWQTIYPTVFRKLARIAFTRERIATPDQDFIDLDWARPQASQNLAILSHGLEGSSNGIYCQGMAQALLNAGWHVLIWNFRGCSGEVNRSLRSYHSGDTGDLIQVLNHVNRNSDYAAISLIGFSLGGNLNLKYLADAGPNLPENSSAAVSISVPCDLQGSAHELERWDNRIYMRRFMKTLTAKVREKMKRFPGQLSDHGLDTMTTFREFDATYTAPLHGFESAEHYWSDSSCGPVLDEIVRPTLLINALDDPFLSKSCYPYAAAEQSDFLHLETPKHGGHLGFVSSNLENTYWSESRTVEFLEAHL